MKIVLDIQCIEKTVSFAGKELCRYLEKMLSQEEGVFSVSLNVQDWNTPMDAYRITMEESGGQIVGRNPRSVLLGVYDYLRYLGCRFLTFQKETEVVPVISRGQLKAEYEKTASFYHRGVCIEGGNSVENILDFIDWLPKVGYNSFFLQFKVPYAFLSRYYHHEKNPYAQPEAFTMEDAKACSKRFEEAMELRSLMLHKVGHGWTGEVLGVDTIGSWDQAGESIDPKKKHMAALCNGERGYFMGIPTNTNLCFSQSDTVETFVEKVISYAKENPTVDYLHIWLADEFNNVCECEDCCKTTVSDQYVRLLNAIDQSLAEHKLSTRVVFLLYQELLWPPIREKLHNPDRFVLMFAPISRTFEASYDLSGECKEIPEYHRNQIELPTSIQENLAFLRGWQQVFEGDSFVYDYPLGRAHYGDFGYLHIARIISQDIKKLGQLKLNGYISCQELRVAMPNMLPNYVMGYTLWDVNADVEDLIAEYYQAAYPEGAELAQTYLEKLSKLSSCDYVNGKGPRVNEEMAERMGEIVSWCEEHESVLEKHQAHGTSWKVLAYHNGYILRLARALQLLAQGQQEESFAAYREMREYVCKGEPSYQPYFDVYRILEVTQKYTGFQNI